jgi:hypothetical protein
MNQNKYIVLIVTITLIVIAILLMRKKIQKSIGIDDNFKHFLYSDFDSRAGKGEVSLLTSYVGVDGNTYISNSGKNNMNREFIHLLDDVQEVTGIDLNNRINSGYRSKQRNNDIGGVNNSAHVLGFAADISTRRLSLVEVDTLLDELKSRGVVRIGYYPTFIHVDIDKSKPQVSWSNK